MADVRNVALRRTCLDGKEQWNRAFAFRQTERPVGGRIHERQDLMTGERELMEELNLKAGIHECTDDLTQTMGEEVG